MKKLVPAALALILIFSLFGCTKPETVQPEVTPTVRPVSVLNATIADISGKTLLLADIDGTAQAGDLFTASGEELEVFGVDGSKAELSDLKAGMSVAVEYDGDISGNTLGRKIPAKRVSIINEGSDIIGFYRDIIAELMASDEALNDDIEMLGFDFSALNNLRESEKTALMYLAAKDAKLEFISGTYDELGAQGLIDTKQLFFPTGVLITITTADESAESFTFSTSKWRGGDGAIGADDNKAKLKNGAWSLKPGGSWIS